MTTSPSEYLNRVFPKRFLFRGAALWSLAWNLAGSVALAAVLLAVLLLIVLIESHGRVELDGDQVAEFYSLFGQSEPVRAEPL